MDPKTLDTNEASNTLRVFREALVVIRERLSSTHLGELLKANQEFNKQNLSLKELEAAFKNNQYQEVLPTLIKKMGGETNIDGWIKNTLLNAPIKELWNKANLQSLPVLSDSDPRWLKDVALLWQKEGNWQHVLETQSPQFNSFSWIGHFIFYLRLYARTLENQINILDGEIEAAKKDQQKESAATQSISQSESAVSQPPKTASEPSKSSETPAEQEAAIRAKQQESVRKKKRAVVLARLRALNVANGKPALGDLALNNLERIIELSTLTGVDIDTLFAQYGLDTALLAIDAKTLAAFKKYALEARSEFSDVNLQEGLSSNVLRSSDVQVNKDLQNSMLSIGKSLGDDVVPLAYGAKLSTLRSRAQDGDVAAAKALKVYEKTIEGVWEPDKGTLKGALNNLTGKTRREQEVLLSDWGIKPTKEEGKITKVSQVLEHLNNQALADIFGIAPEEVMPLSPQETSMDVTNEVQPQAQPKEKKESAVNPQRFKQFADVTKSIAMNPATPFIAGGATVVGMGLYGALTQGLAGGLGAATFSLGGAIAGGLGGFFVGGPIGSIIGAIAGGVGGGAVSLSWHPYGGASAAQIVGGAEARAAGINLGINPNAVATTAGQTVTTGARVATSLLPSSTALGAGATNALGGISAGIQSLSSMPSFFATSLHTAILIISPIATAGLITVLIVIPTLLAPYLIPSTSNLNLSASSGACWPTDGTIWVLATYPQAITKNGQVIFAAGSKHATFQEGADPMDIVGARRTPIYTTFAGSAIADIEAGGAKVVTVTTPEGVKILSAHMDAFAIPENQKVSVSKGQLIGYMGDTGFADGVHLHYEVLGKTLSQIVPSSPPLVVGSVVKHDQCNSGSSAQKQCFKDAQNVVDEAKKIIATLEPGVWGMWNYTPLYPQHAEFSKPPSVPDVFYDVILKYSRKLVGMEAYQPDDLFWCAWLVSYAYHDATPPVPAPMGAGVSGLRNNWEKDGKIIKLVDEIRPSDVPLGSAIGFDKYYNPTNFEKDAHIGLVCGKQFDASGENGSITTCESNDGAISNTINVVNGKVQDLVLDPFTTLRTMWFGLPPQTDPTGKCGGTP